MSSLDSGQHSHKTHCILSCLFTVRQLSVVICHHREWSPHKRTSVEKVKFVRRNDCDRGQVIFKVNVCHTGTLLTSFPPPEGTSWLSDFLTYYPCDCMFVVPFTLWTCGQTVFSWFVVYYVVIKTRGKEQTYVLVFSRCLIFTQTQRKYTKRWFCLLWNDK
jgi:hypothetical protein